MSYYTAKVQLLDDSTGKQKRVTEMYLVEAMSVTEAESKVVKVKSKQNPCLQLIEIGNRIQIKLEK